MSARQTIADAIALAEQHGNAELAARLRAIKLPGAHGDPEHIDRLADAWEAINAEVERGRDPRDVTADWDRRHKGTCWWNIWKLKDNRLRRELQQRGWELHKPRGQNFFRHTYYVAI